MIVEADEAVTLASLGFRPEELGATLQYNVAAVDPFDKRTSQLIYQETPIDYYDIVSDSSLTYDYIMNILTQNLQTGEQFLSQQGIIVDKGLKEALFEEIQAPYLASASD